MKSRSAFFGSLGPVAGAGLLLLVAGALLLVVGGLWFAGDPATVSLWNVLIGLVVLIGAMAVLLWEIPQPIPRRAEPAPRTAPRSTPTPRSPRPTPVRPAPMAAAPPRVPPASVARSVERAVAMSADVPFRSARSALASTPTSIPGAYLQSLENAEPRNGDLWADVAPPMAAALPFSAGLQRGSDGSPPWLESPETTHEEPRLELELARLRARVRELEAIPGPTTMPKRAPSTALSFAITAGRVPEPPTPPSGSVVGRRNCAGCGSEVASAGPSVLCWGCGRALCASCYWRFGPGPGLHRCPDCLARAPADPVAISGGRAAAGANGSSPVSTRPPQAAAPPTR